MATINDLVLVHVEDKPGFYARIEDIAPDVKKGWWVVRLLVLTFPLQVYTWILDETQIDGASFTMGGTPLKIEKIVSPVNLEEEKKSKKKNPEPSPGGTEPARPKVVSLLDRKKNS
jgi:hypothetical protein